MEDIEAFSATYRAKLDEAENAKSIPENISLEVAANLYLFCYSFSLVCLLYLFPVEDAILYRQSVENDN